MCFTVILSPINYLKRIRQSSVILVLVLIDHREAIDPFFVTLNGSGLLMPPIHCILLYDFVQ